MGLFPDILILAGGFGTRLQSVVKDVPKPMAPVAGKPFLEWLLNYLEFLKPNKIILSTGYKHETIAGYFGNNFKNIPIDYSVETDPLGTGGAIKRAFNFVESQNFLVLNGDTFLQIDHLNFLNYHIKSKALFSMALKPLKNPTRYGTVETSGESIKKFNEKNPDLSQGLINTGVYLMNKMIISHFPLQEKFSFETNFMELKTGEIEMKGFITDDYFIDIGIPEDYKKANDEFPNLFN
ncbi:MAG: nucleotidyltransferase family protein [Bacteroidia bacterium]